MGAKIETVRHSLIPRQTPSKEQNTPRPTNSTCIPSAHSVNCDASENETKAIIHHFLRLNGLHVSPHLPIGDRLLPQLEFVLPGASKMIDEGIAKQLPGDTVLRDHLLHRLAQVFGQALAIAAFLALA